MLFFSNTLEIILVTAMEHNGVVGEGFQMVAFPAAIEMERFLDIHAFIPFFELGGLVRSANITSHRPPRGN